MKKGEGERERSELRLKDRRSQRYKTAKHGHWESSREPSDSKDGRFQTSSCLGLLSPDSLGLRWSPCPCRVEFRSAYVSSASRGSYLCPPVVGCSDCCFAFRSQSRTRAGGDFPGLPMISAHSILGRGDRPQVSWLLLRD